MEQPEKGEEKRRQWAEKIERKVWKTPRKKRSDRMRKFAFLRENQAIFECPMTKIVLGQTLLA